MVQLNLTTIGKRVGIEFVMNIEPSLTLKEKISMYNQLMHRCLRTCRLAGAETFIISYKEEQAINKRMDKDFNVVSKDTVYTLSTKVPTMEHSLITKEDK